MARHASARALSNKMNNDREDCYIAIALPGFNDLGCSLTPIFLLTDRFLYRFSLFKLKVHETELNAFILKMYVLCVTIKSEIDSQYRCKKLKSAFPDN